MKKLIAYVTNRALDIFTREDALRLTHINLAFGTITDGALDMRALPSIGRCRDIRIWNPDIKIVLSVGGWGAGGFSDMALTAEGCARFVESAAKAVDEFGLDGIDIDWEYPCSDLAGIDADPRDKHNFTLLLAGLRAALGDERIVSIAAGGGEYFIDGTEMDEVARICDYVQLMTYDLRSGFCRVAGHHTSLYPAKGDPERLSVDATVDMFLRAGVPADKIVIGAAMYSRVWRGVPDVNGGLLQPAQTVGEGGPGYAELLTAYPAHDPRVHWDEAACAPYIYDGGRLISYDDERSMACKCEYLLRRNLAGIMYWEHSCDPTRALLMALYSALNA